MKKATPSLKTPSNKTPSNSSSFGSGQSTNDLLSRISALERKVSILQSKVNDFPKKEDIINLVKDETEHGSDSLSTNYAIAMKKQKDYQARGTIDYLVYEYPNDMIIHGVMPETVSIERVMRGLLGRWKAEVLFCSNESDYIS
jgi:hypothetical protein